MGLDNGVVKSGQQYEPKENITFPYVEQVVEYTGPDSLRVTGEEGQAGREIIPMDAAAAKVRRYDLDAIQATLDAIVERHPTYVDIDFPPVLTGFTSVYSADQANGTASNVATSATVGSDELALSFNASAKAQGSAGLIADIVPDITQKDGQDCEGIEYFFFAALTITMTQVLARLQTIIGTAVAKRPHWHKVPLTLVAFGGKRAETAEGEFAEAVKVTSTGTVYRSFSEGTGRSGDVSLNSKLIQIPPTLHAALTLPTGVTQGFSVQATLTGATSLTQSGSGAVVSAGFRSSAANLAATSPAAIPTTGLYLWHIDTQTYGYDRNLIRCVVVNMAAL